MSQTRKPALQPQDRPQPAKAETDSTSATADFDYDKQIVEATSRFLWEAIATGDFKLAIRCRRCGRWLVDGRSKRRHYGPRCAAAIAAQEVTA